MSMTQELTRRSKIDANYWRFRRERYVQDKGDRMLSSLVISHAAIRIQPQEHTCIGPKQDSQGMDACYLH